MHVVGATAQSICRCAPCGLPSKRNAMEQMFCSLQACLLEQFFIHLHLKGWCWNSPTCGACVFGGEHLLRQWYHLWMTPGAHVRFSTTLWRKWSWMPKRRELGFAITFRLHASEVHFWHQAYSCKYNIYSCLTLLVTRDCVFMMFYSHLSRYTVPNEDDEPPPPSPDASSSRTWLVSFGYWYWCTS